MNQRLTSIENVLTQGLMLVAGIILYSLLCSFVIPYFQTQKDTSVPVNIALIQQKCLLKMAENVQNNESDQKELSEGSPSRFGLQGVSNLTPVYPVDFGCSALIKTRR